MKYTIKILTLIMCSSVQAEQPWMRAYFSPDDKLDQKFISHIKQEQEAISVAIYTLTHKAIVQELIAAHQRGIQVTIILDEFSLIANKGNPPIQSLLKADVPVFLFNPKLFYHGGTGDAQLFYNEHPFLSSYHNLGHFNHQKKMSPEQRRQLSIRPVMHHKFCIFNKNSEDASLVWTGSFNFTHSAATKNQENALVIRDTTIVQAFKEQFEIIKQERATRIHAQNPCIGTHEKNSCQLLFTPDEHVIDRLIDLIDGEQTSIKVAIYSFSHQDVVDALIRAHNRGVHLEVVLDHGKKEQLAQAGIATYLFSPEKYASRASPDPDESYDSELTRYRSTAIMHNKFCIFGNNTKNRSLLWTGSINFTYFSTHLFQNNAMIIDDPATIAQFEKQFELIKTQRSSRYYTKKWRWRRCNWRRFWKYN